jgi:S-formylglutathione hydrolase FrmB
MTLAAGAVAGGYELVQHGTLPGKYQLAKVLGQCGGPPVGPSRPPPTRRVATFYSAYRRRQVTTVTLIPSGVTFPRGLAVIIALHGRGGDALGQAPSAALAMASPQLPPDLARRFAVITVDGGNTYWHRRADGDDPRGMIVHEVLPRAAAIGLRTDRIGVTGISMGGYGALLLAEQLPATPTTVTTRAAASPSAAAATQIAAVAAISPAIFASYADARQADRGAFDSPADFSRNDVFSDVSALRHVPAFVACGTDDPFEPTAEHFRARLQQLTSTAPAGAIASGCHDTAFWERNLPSALTFLTRHLI